MRVLVADHDAKTLQELARALADDFTVDVATSKLSCLAMLDVSEFHVVLACERLEDGSGLELLSQAGKRWPEVLRVFAIEPDRLPLLAGRLKPFRLFETIPYPIDARKLRNLLTLAQAAEEAHVDTMNVQHIVLEDEVGVAAQRRVAAAQSGRASAPRASAAPARSAPAPTGRAPSPATNPSSRRASTPAPHSAARTALSAALHAHVAEHGSGTPAPAARFDSPRHSAPRRDGSERRGTISVSSDADSFADIDALAAASEIAQAMRPKLERSSDLFGGGRRTTLLIVAAVAAAAVAAAAAIMYGGSKSSDTASPAPVATLKSVEPVAADVPADGEPASPAQMSFDRADAAAPMVGRSGAEPPEVAAFVADIESALTVDNFERARRLLDMLREVAPDHSRLAFFDALITRGEDTKRVQGEVARAAAGNATRAGDRFAEASSRPADREIAARRQASIRSLAPSVPSASGSASATKAPASRPVLPIAPAETRASSLPSVSPPAAPLSNTFSGRTLEDSAGGGSPSGSAQPETDAPRRPAVVLPVVKDAKVVRQVDPEYPREAMREGIEGSIDLRFTVTADGKVEDIEVVTADPPQTFDRAAMSALRRWRYEPRREDGVAVDSRTRVRLEFKLEKNQRPGR
jgi:protein TonB